MRQAFWFNLWQRRNWPLDEIAAGDSVYWYETSSQRIVWQTRVKRVERFAYDTKADVAAKLTDLFGPFDEHQNYFVDGPVAGFCLAYTVEPLRKLNVPKPPDVRFPLLGWVRLDKAVAKEWSIKLSGEDVDATRNPPWSRDELILALDVYFRYDAKTIVSSHPAIKELSGVLNVMGQRMGRIRSGKFRNLNGVYMKLCNFLRFDPTYSGTGLKGGSKLEEKIWHEFSENRKELHRLATAIRDTMAQPAPMFAGADTDDEEEFPEGAVLYRMHVRRERNRDLVEKAKRRAKQKNGGLRCEICEFDFSAVYGVLGQDYIECHHTVPVSEMKPGSKTRLEDVALLCSNCHRMVHRRRPWLRLTDLHSIVRVKAASA